MNKEPFIAIFEIKDNGSTIHIETGEFPVPYELVRPKVQYHEDNEHHWRSCRLYASLIATCDAVAFRISTDSHTQVLAFFISAVLETMLVYE